MSRAAAKSGSRSEQVNMARRMGIEARKAGRPREDCPYAVKDVRDGWLQGYDYQDQLMARHAQGQLL